MSKGAVFALFAAILNALVGTFSLSAFNTGISAGGVACYKCVIAVCVLSVFVVADTRQRKAWMKLLPHAHKIALIAFFGIFILYYFETRAYLYSSISAVTFTLLGTSTITTFLGSYIILKKNHSILAWVAMLLAMFGITLFQTNISASSGFNIGLIFAALAGSGYGLFLVLNKRNPENFHGVAMLWWLVFFGSIYLVVPYSFVGIELPTKSALMYIGLLGVASTIGGFYFTTKALSLASATTVQLFELSEPLFATALGLVVFHQSVTLHELLGGALILSAIYLSSKSDGQKPGAVENSVLVNESH